MGAENSTSGGNGNETVKATPEPKKNKNKTLGMGPGQSMAMAGNTGLASATEKQISKITGLTGKSFKATGQKIGEVGSKYRRPADVEKYAKEAETILEGAKKGAKKFIGPDGVERVSFVGTGMKDEQGRTILSKQMPELKATAPTLKQLGGDIARGIMGYNTLEYQGDSNVPTMVRKKGLIEMTPTTALFNAIKVVGFFNIMIEIVNLIQQPLQIQHKNLLNHKQK